MSQPFYRSIALHASILSIIASTPNPITASYAIAALPEYRSRGHGGKHSAHRSRPNFSSGSACNNPHQGERECQRRVSQARGMWLKSTPRRMWAGYNYYPYMTFCTTRKEAASISQKNGAGYYAELQ